MKSFLAMLFLTCFIVCCTVTDQPSKSDNTSNKVIDQEFYKNGKVFIEHLQLGQTDTIIRKVYSKTGQLELLSHLLDGKRNGKYFIYAPTGYLLFEEYYIDGKLHDQSKCFYPDGKIQRVDKYDHGKHVDTSFYYSESGIIFRETIYDTPCELGSSDCNKTIIEYQNGVKIYAYKVIEGWKSDEHQVFDEMRYAELVKAKAAIPLLEQGENLFNSNCAACHGMKKEIIGPPMKKAILNKTDNQLYEIIVSSDQHPSSKLSKAEFELLLNYLKKGIK
jgi:hypothetical protein